MRALVVVLVLALLPSFVFAANMDCAGVGGEISLPGSGHKSHPIRVSVKFDEGAQKLYVSGQLGRQVYSVVPAGSGQYFHLAGLPESYLVTFDSIGDSHMDAVLPKYGAVSGLCNPPRSDCGWTTNPRPPGCTQ